MNVDIDMTNSDNAHIQSISKDMASLKVPDDNNTLTCEFLKDGKLFFIETKLRAEAHPVIAEKLLHFRSYRAGLEQQQQTDSTDIPPSYLDVIAALVQDSDEPFTVLLSRINDTLSPFMRNESMAHKFDTAIEKVVKKIAHRVNYGLKEDVYANIEHSTPKVPWHLYLSRWEVHDYQLFPPEVQLAVFTRRKAREYMTETISSFIYNLPQQERSTIVNTKHRKSPVAHKEMEETRSKQSTETEQEREEKRKKKEEEKRKRDEEKKQMEEEKRIKDEEKKAIEEEKKRQREEEKRIKEEERKKREEEKRKKEQSQLRLTSLFAKTSILETAPPVEKLLEPEKPTLFPAFYIKDNVSIADINQCPKSKNISSYQAFKSLVKASNASVSKDEFISQLKGSSRKRGVSTHIDFRNLLLPGSADILHVPNVRLVLRMKLLQFSEDVRPAYFGTFTKKSHKVNGRQPFAKDNDTFDYDVDSEAEWEPEGEGDDIVSGDEDDDDPNTDMIDPEDAGWLVPEGYLSDNEGVDEDRPSNKASFATNSSKRLAIRKIVLGPFFGDTEESDALKPFETHLFFSNSEEGYNPFYKEPASRATATSSVPSSSSSTPSTTHTKSEFTDEHRNALISVINEKSGDSIPNLITEAKANWLLKDVSKRQLEANIKNIAIKEKRGTDTKPTWYIKQQPPA